MDMENDFLHIYSSNVQETHFKCDICVLTFRTPSERNEHILSHLQKTTCSVCHLTLIQLGNIWYSPHEHTNHNIIKNETDLVEEIECHNLSIYYPNNDGDDTNQLQTKHELDDGDGEEVVNDDAIENSTEMDIEMTFEPKLITSPEHVELKLVDIVDILTNSATNNQCDVCGKTFCKPSNLTRHKKLHTNAANSTKSTNTQRTISQAQKKWQCVSCKMAFSSRANLVQHQKTPCDSSDGNSIDRTNSEPNNDLQKVQSKGTKSCHICDKKFPSSNTLESHLNVHFGIRPYQCKICSKTWTNKKSLREHEKRHIVPISTKTQSSNIVNDVVCKEAIVINENALNIMKSTHTQQTDAPTQKVWQCVSCKVEFSFRANLIQHQKTSCDSSDGNGIRKIQPYGKITKSCHICDKEFPSGNTLESHLNVHLGVRPYKCKICSKTWTNKKCLRRHEKKHVVPVSHIVPESSNIVDEVICEKAISIDENHENDLTVSSVINVSDMNESQLDKSDERKNENRVKKKVCGVCNKSFVKSSTLKYHMNVHLDLRPYECNDCDKKFRDRRSLNEHQKTHGTYRYSDINSMDDVEISADENGEQIIITPYQLYKSSFCPICDKQFETNLRVRMHLKVHKLLFKCKLCQSAFLTMEQCQSHKSTHRNLDGVNFHQLEDTPHRENALVDWMCEYCNQVFELEIFFAKHIKKDHSDDKHEHQCNICASVFSNSNDLLAHMRAHPESSRHKCDFNDCSQTFAYKSILGVHLSKHKLNNQPIIRKTQDNLTEAIKQKAMLNLDGKCDDYSLIEEALACHICTRKFSNETVLRYHVERVHTNSRLKCTVAECDKIFKTNGGLWGHVKKHHPEAVKKCDVCSKNFYSDGQLAKHRLKHEGRISCDICSKSFTQNHHLKAHLSTHEKEILCNLCDKKFATVRSMLEHRERHGKKKVVRCKFKGCNQTFDNHRTLSLHSKQHPDNEKRKFICSICGKKLSQGGFQGHMNAHTGDRPFICKVCGKSFSKCGNLRRHTMIHTGEKPYICDIGECTEAYRDKIDLNRHKFSVHKIYTKKHVCTICSKIFSENKLLTKHIKSVHGSNQTDSNTDD